MPSNFNDFDGNPIEEKDLPSFMRMPAIPTHDQMIMSERWRDLIFDFRCPGMREPILTAIYEYTDKGLEELIKVIEWEKGRRKNAKT